MAGEDELKQNTLSSMLVAIRATPLAGKVDANQTLFAMSNSWNKLFVNGVLDLQALYNHLMNGKGVTPNEAAQVCLLLHKRQEKLGLKVKLPPMVDTLPPKFREELMATLPKNTGLTHPGTPQKLNTTTARPPEPQKAPEKVDMRPINLGGGKRKIGGVTILVAVLGGIAAAVLSIPQPARRMAKAELPLPPNTAGWEVGQEEGTFFLFVPEKDWTRPKPEIETIAKTAMQSAKSRRGVRVLLCEFEDAACAIPRAVTRRDGSLEWIQRLQQ